MFYEVSNLYKVVDIFYKFLLSPNRYVQINMVEYLCVKWSIVHIEMGHRKIGHKTAI